MALLFPLVLLGIMYAFLILPQRKRQKAHAELLRAVAPGDEILTTGGIYGGVTEIDGDDLYLEIAPDVEVKISRRAVAERLTVTSSSPAAAPSTLPEPQPEPETPELEEPVASDGETTQKGFKKK
jgi:preprotein translocase subunit YajC